MELPNQDQRLIEISKQLNRIGFVLEHKIAAELAKLNMILMDKEEAEQDGDEG